MDAQGSDTRTNEILRSLTPPQREAVCHVDGPLLIIAGPGSGKTRVVTHRIAHLLEQSIPAWQILALTFTNKAADEMRLRLERLAPRQPVWVSTFHRFCARLLRRQAPLVGLSENFSIYDADDSAKLLADVIAAEKIELTHVTADQVAREISSAKNNLTLADQFVPRPGQVLGEIVAQVYPAYQKRLLAANAADFDDLLLHVAMLLRENPELRETLDQGYRYILVDEYQDTNFAQYCIVRALSQDYPNLAVTGDPDQSIYGWRGANLNNILEFEHDFPQVRVVRLERNYRSTPSILRVADHLIEHNARRKQKALYTENPEGPPVRLVVYPSSRDEAENIAAQIAGDIYQGGRRARDFAVFYRVNSLSRGLEHALRSNGVPYQIVKGLEFYARKEIKDVIAYLHLLNNPRNDVAFLRIINTPPRQIGKTTVARLAEHARRYRLSMLDAAREAGLIESLAKRAEANVAAFVAICDRLSLVASAPVEEILGQVLTETGYEKWLADSDAQEDEERVANIAELLNDAREFDERRPGEGHLEEFLEQTSLVNDTDDWEMEVDKVSLMTLHAAKGLEFPVVYITAVEQGMLPHRRSKDDFERLEEERRLLFVGITRAEQELQLSMATRRFSRGTLCPTVPSPFLVELPRDEMEIHQPSPVRQDEHASQDLSDWQAVDEEGRSIAAASDDSKPPPVAKRARVMTAAEMLGQPAADLPKVSPEVFCQGMVVNHPEHGLGRIVALSGQGSKRTASVQFVNASRQRKFRLAFSDLRPVKSPD